MSKDSFSGKKQIQKRKIIFAWTNKMCEQETFLARTS